MQKEAVVIGHNYNSILGIARALGAEGYKILVIRTDTYTKKLFLRKIVKTPESKSKYVNLYLTANVETDEQIMDILLHRFASKEGKKVLFPVDDRCAEIIDRHYDELEPLYYMPNVNNEQNGIVRSMDKYYQKQLAKAAGLPVPQGWSVKIEDGKYIIPDGVIYPCFVKAEMPMNGRKGYMRKCDNKDELIAALNNVANHHNCIMIIEEYIDVEREYCIVGLCNREKVCIPEVIDEKIMGHGPHAGATCYGKVLQPSFMDDFINKLKPFLKQLSFQGLFTVDVLKSGDKYYFCELNMRIGGSGLSVIGAGVNIVKMYAEVLEGNDSIDYESLCKELSFASERPLLSDYSLGYISWRQYKDLIKNADYRFIYDKNDKKPYYHYAFVVLLGMLRRTIRTIKRVIKRQ